MNPTIRILFLFLPLLVAGCSGGGSAPTTTATTPTYETSFKIIGESGTPLTNAAVAVNGVNLSTDAQGFVQVNNLTGPVVAVASAPGHLTEPIVAGWQDEGKIQTIRLLSDEGGRRWVMHSAGDTMLGRRYQYPATGTPLVPLSNAAEGGSRVVGDIAKAFAVGDLNTLNLETAVSDSTSEAYPGKRFILNTPPAAMSALKDLGVDVAFLANNHTRDYGEEGLRQTTASLDAKGIKHQGASDNESTAYDPVVVTVNGVRVGMLSWTTVTGSAVNDSYPVDGDPIPGNLPAAEMWQYESRSWGYESSSMSVPVASRRIGSAWRIYRDTESSMSAEDRAAAWASLTATYPELQDWVARRGHGGGAYWRNSESPAAITALKQTADLAVVQLHSGYQYSTAPSENLRQNARMAIDAGADIVIGHHPHVTQGFEWYKGRLIAYSLGNFVFDQDFLATFSGFFLRTVWDGNTLVEARLIPTELSDYRPVLTSGAASLRTALKAWEMSLMSAESREGKNIEINKDANTVLANIKRDGSSYLITGNESSSASLNLTLSPGESAPVQFSGLIDPRLGLASGTSSTVHIGRGLFGWGGFEDETADTDSDGSTHWATEGTRKEVVAGDAAEGRRFLRLTRYSTNETSVLVRPLARVPLQQHRLYREADGVIIPADPPATYTLRFKARISAAAEAKVNFQCYLFDDSDPTADPSSTVIAQRSTNLQLIPGTAWQQMEIEIPSAVLESDAGDVNQILFSLQLYPPVNGMATLDIDELEFVEWRSASKMPAKFGAYSWVKNTGSSAMNLQFQGLPIMQ